MCNFEWVELYQQIIWAKGRFPECTVCLLSHHTTVKESQLYFETTLVKKVRPLPFFPISKAVDVQCTKVILVF